MLKAVIFDMDGVLIDSEPIHLEANKRLMESLSIPFDKEYYLQFVGSTTDYMWNKIITDYNITLSKDELMEKSNEFVKEINGEDGYPVMEGASELIRRLKSAGIRLAVASSSGMERITNTLNKLCVEELFDGII
ncbi:MAG: HAD family phosphatase, partial [Lachnospiraceae bacterium]|nr:HAD family phosphatase [Lachnospiraceae bacterium]